MKNAWTVREHFKVIDNIAITRATFEQSFFKTKERIEFTFNGWDGKFYNGETRRAYVYRTSIPGYEDVRFIKVGKGVHYVDEDCEVLEKATGLTHKSVSWLVDVLPATK